MRYRAFVSNRLSRFPHDSYKCSVDDLFPTTGNFVYIGDRYSQLFSNFGL